jgi:ArsR family transcriptional regulator
MKPLIRILKACADDNRLRILKMLQHREMCVCELTEALDIAQPSVSRHLKMLEDAGLIVHRRDGLWINYRLDPELSNPYVRVILSHLRDWLEDDPEIRSLIQKASGLNREVICRRDTPRSEGSTTQKADS